SSSVTLITCDILWNRANEGGGICCRVDSNVSLTDCTIRGNSAAYGAGVYCSDASPSFVRCAVEENDAAYGGGMYCVIGGASFDRCSIARNTAITSSGYGSGGGFYGIRSDAIYTNCVLSHNIVGFGGGGFYTEETSLLLENCILSANVAWRGGGVLAHDASSLTIRHCTVNANSAEEGSGLQCHEYPNEDPSTVQVVNSIFWNGPDEVVNSGDSDITIEYSNVQGGYDGAGNIDAEPIFAFTGDPHLMPGSPGIDAGTNTPPGGLPAHDRDGNPRKLDGDGDFTLVADMGAYEYNAGQSSVALDASFLEFTAESGRQNPFPQTLTLRNCGGGVLNWQASSDSDWLNVTPTAGDSSGELDETSIHIDIADLTPGDYYGAITIDDPIGANTPRQVTVALRLVRVHLVPSEYPRIQDAIDASRSGDVIELADGVYTGEGNKNLEFDGRNLVVRSASGDPTRCIIDCEEDGRGFLFRGGEGPKFVLKGVTITNGGRSYEGGGIMCYNESSPTIVDCIISNCALTGSSAQGGGLYFGAQCNSTLINCAIVGNGARAGWYSGWGGGMYCDEAEVTLINCRFIGNTASGDEQGYGGAIYCHTKAKINLISCTFVGNDADYGPALACNSSQQTDISTIDLTNAVLWNGADAIWNGDDSTITITYSAVQGGWTGPGNIDADPLFVDHDGPDDDPLTWEDNDYRLNQGSPCIDAGDNTVVPADTFDLDNDGNTTEPTPLDLAGDPRFLDDPDTIDTGNPGAPGPLVDMGACEFQVDPICPGDVDGDGDTDQSDLGLLLVSYERLPGDPFFNPDADLNGDGEVGQPDLGILLADYNCAP
ncbi:MAG: right-handed parallel beta-helix repeat-containing protein, partial [Phycisphaerales bacterium JB038]